MTASPKMILLKTSDGETFKLDEAVAIESQTIKQMIDGNCLDNTIPLPNITSKILSKVIEYCKRHATKNIDVLIEDDLKAFDAEFMKMDQRTLFDLIMAAYYLDIKSLIDLTCQTIADMLKGKSVEEIRMTCNIVNDRTPEEEEDIRKEYAWAFE